VLLGVSTRDTSALVVCKSTLFFVLTSILVDGVPMASESNCGVTTAFGGWGVLVEQTGLPGEYGN
jgi:hypothetical protein